MFSLVKAKAYLTFVRPMVECAAVIWSPYTTSDITALEAMQCKAARFVCNDFLKWNSLEDRRKQAKLIMFIKLFTD